MNNVTTYRSVYSGDFRAVTPYGWMRGAYHAADVYLMFGGARYFAWQELGPKVIEAGKYLQNAIANFVRDPERGLAETGWPRYDGTGELLLLIVAQPEILTLMLLQVERWSMCSRSMILPRQLC